MACVASKCTAPGARPNHIMINEAAKRTQLSNNVYCCKSGISPFACTEIERVVPRADPRRHERRVTLCRIRPDWPASKNCFFSVTKFMLRLFPQKLLYLHTYLVTWYMYTHQVRTRYHLHCPTTLFAPETTRYCCLRRPLLLKKTKANDFACSFVCSRKKRKDTYF